MAVHNDAVRAGLIGGLVGFPLPKDCREAPRPIPRRLTYILQRSRPALASPPQPIAACVDAVRWLPRRRGNYAPLLQSQALSYHSETSADRARCKVPDHSPDPARPIQLSKSD